MARVRGGLALLATLCPLRPAHAQETSVTERELDPKTGAAVKEEDLSLTYVTVGPNFSLIGGPASGTAFGLEGTLMHYLEPRIPSFGYGAFLQTQLYNGNALRLGLGGQVAVGPAGVELGLGLRQGEGGYAGTIGVHAGFFLSVGYFVFTVRASPALVAFPSNEPSYGFETAFTFGLKVPITVQGRDPTGWAVQATGHRW